MSFGEEFKKKQNRKLTIYGPPQLSKVKTVPSIISYKYNGFTKYNGLGR
jgi:hypothetical protein